MSNYYRTPERFRKVSRHMGDVVDDAKYDVLKLSSVAISALPRAINEHRYNKTKRTFLSITEELKTRLALTPELEIGWGDTEKGIDFYFRTSKHGDCWQLKQTLPTGRKEVSFSMGPGSTDKYLSFMYREYNEDETQMRFETYPCYGSADQHRYMQFARQELVAFISLLPSVDELARIQENMPIEAALGTQSEAQV